MKRLHQSVLIGATLVASWFGMQAIHECGHVLGAFLTGAEVKRVALDPLSISRTDIGLNPNPLFVVWAGPIFGVLIPLIVWKIVAAIQTPGTFVFRFFSGFCCIANGAYIAIGSFEHIGDCGEMLIHGSEKWMLWLFGAVTIPTGLWLWHRQGNDFGFGTANGAVNRPVTYATLVVCILLIAFGFSIGGK